MQTVNALTDILGYAVIIVVVGVAIAVLLGRR